MQTYLVLKSFCNDKGCAFNCAWSWIGDHKELHGDVLTICRLTPLGFFLRQRRWSLRRRQTHVPLWLLSASSWPQMVFRQCWMQTMSPKVQESIHPSSDGGIIGPIANHWGTKANYLVRLCDRVSGFEHPVLAMSVLREHRSVYS